MNKYAIVKQGQKPNKKQEQEIEKLKSKKAIPDEETPELTIEQMEQYRIAAIKKRKERQKQVLTLRVSADTMNKAKALGKGYTGILSRMLELCLNDSSIIEKCL